MVNLVPNLKFLASTGYFKRLKVGNVAPPGPPMNKSVHFLLEPFVINMCAKIEVSSFNSCREMQGVAKFQK